MMLPMLYTSERASECESGAWCEMRAARVPCVGREDQGLGAEAVEQRHDEVDARSHQQHQAGTAGDGAHLDIETL